MRIPAHSLDELRRQQAPETLAGILVAGFAVNVDTAATLLALDTLAAEHGLSLFRGGDPGSNELDPDAARHFVSGRSWVVGKDTLHLKNDSHTAFTWSPGGQLGELLTRFSSENVIPDFAASRGLVCSAPSIFLVGRGPLPSAMLLKGTFVDFEGDEDDEDELLTWLDECIPNAGPEGNVGYRSPTRGATQDPYPGVVHGVYIAGADDDVTPVTLSVELDRAIDEKLAEANIHDAKYYLLTRYD